MNDIDSGNQFDLTIVPKVNEDNLDKLEQRLDALDDKDVNIGVKVDETDLDKLKKSLDPKENKDLEINIKVNSPEKKQIDSITRFIDKINNIDNELNKNISVKINASESIKNLTSELSKISDQPPKITPEVDLKKAKKDIASMMEKVEENAVDYDFKKSNATYEKSAVSSLKKDIESLDELGRKLYDSAVKVKNYVESINSPELNKYYADQIDRVQNDYVGDDKSVDIGSLLEDPLGEFELEVLNLKEYIKRVNSGLEDSVLGEMLRGKFDYSKKPQTSAKKEASSGVTKGKSSSQKEASDIAERITVEFDSGKIEETISLLSRVYDSVDEINQKIERTSDIDGIAGTVEQIRSDIAVIAANLNEGVLPNGGSADTGGDNSEIISAMKTLLDNVNGRQIVSSASAGNVASTINANINSHDILQQAGKVQNDIQKYISSIETIKQNGINLLPDDLLSEKDMNTLLSRLWTLKDGIDSVMSAAETESGDPAAILRANENLNYIMENLTDIQENNIGSNLATDISQSFNRIDQTIKETEDVILSFENNVKVFNEHGINADDSIAEIDRLKASIEELVRLKSEYTNAGYSSPDDISELIKKTDNKIGSQKSVFSDSLDLSARNSNTMDDIEDFDDNLKQLGKLSDKITKLKKLLIDTRNAGINFSEIGIGDEKTLNDLEKFLQTYERLTAMYKNISPIQFSDETDLKNFADAFNETLVTPMKDYINFIGVAEQNLKELKSLNAESKRAESAINSSFGFQKKLEDARNRVQKWGESNSKALKTSEFAQKYHDLLDAISSGSITSDSDLKDFNAQWAMFNAQVTKAGMNGKTFTTILGEMYKKFGGWTLVTRSLDKALNLMQDMVTQVKEVDSAMTDLKKVTTSTGQELNEYLDNAGSKSVDLGTSLTDYIGATSEFSRLGYSLDKAEELGEIATKYKTVAEDLDITTASQSIISTMQAFGELGVDANEIVDKFNYTGNNFAITSAGLGDALKRSASSLYAANNSLSESIAMITAGNTVVQDVDTMGTHLKTISARIRGTTSELGDDAEEMTMTTSELRDEIKNISGVDIMVDDDTFKSTYQVFDELSKVYKSLSDTEQASISEMLGGKNGHNVVEAILENFDTARQIVKELDSGEAVGSADKELEASLDSINGKLNQLQSTWQQISTDTLDSGLIKGLLDLLINIGTVLDKLIDKTDGCGAGLATLAGTTIAQAWLKNKTGSGRAKLFALIEYARISSGGNTERVCNVIVLQIRELLQNYRTWREIATSFIILVREGWLKYRLIRRQAYI